MEPKMKFSFLCDFESAISVSKNKKCLDFLKSHLASAESLIYFSCTTNDMMMKSRMG